MQFDPALQSNADNYKLLTNLVVPRPIAVGYQPKSNWHCKSGPVQLFQCGWQQSFYVVVSIGKRDNGELKDTAEKHSVQWRVCGEHGD